MTITADSDEGVSLDFQMPVAINALGDVAVTVDPEPGSMFPIGTTNVVVTATDDSGKSVLCAFRVTVTADSPAGQTDGTTDTTTDGGEATDTNNPACNPFVQQSLFGSACAPCLMGGMFLTFLGLIGMKHRRVRRRQA